MLNKVLAGDLTRVIITTMPRAGKSEIVSRHFPALALGQNPDCQYIGASYSAKLAQRMSRDVQRIMDSPTYLRLFPETRLKGQASSFTGRKISSGKYIRTSEMFEVVERKGYCLYAGVGGGLTGSGGDLVCVDDPIKNWEEAISPVYRDRAWDWWTSVLMTRLSKAGRVVLTLTRWNYDDIAGRLQRLMQSDPEADQYTIINLPAFKVGPPTSIDPRKDGEALWPNRYGERRLKQLRAGSPRKFQSLYQNDPIPDGGNVVDRSWWKRYGRREMPDKFDRVVLSADLAFKGGKQNDYTVFQVWGVLGVNKYLLHQVRDQMNWVAQKRRFLAVCEARPEIGPKWIEDAANAAALVSEMKDVIAGVRPIATGKTSKVARAQAVSDEIAAGNVWLPASEDAPWAEAYMDEWQQFPNGDHDDQVDATSQFLLNVGAGIDYSKLTLGGSTKRSAHMGTGRLGR